LRTAHDIDPGQRRRYVVVACEAPHFGDQRAVEIVVRSSRALEQISGPGVVIAVAVASLEVARDLGLDASPKHTQAGAT